LRRSWLRRCRRRATGRRTAFNQARDGQRPDLSKPFDAHGARSDPKLAAVRDDVIGVIESTITRAFRPAFLLCAGFAAAALVVAFALRRRLLA
jgi:hypothetical protein